MGYENFRGQTFEGRLRGQTGRYVFDEDGRMLGFVPDSYYKDNTSDTIVWGPRGTIVLVVLRDGTLQNPDDSPSEYQDPFEYLLDHAAEIDQWYSPEQDETNIELTALGTERRVVQVAGIEIPFALLPNDYGLFLLIGRTMADIQSFETLLAGLLVVRFVSSYQVLIDSLGVGILR